jgi:N-glycosidase YbiA
MTVYFYSDREQPYGCFSNFSAHGFMLDELWWATSEHYFQAQKCVGTPHLEAIRQAKKPKDAANMGRDCNLPEFPRFCLLHRRITTVVYFQSMWQNPSDGCLI